MSKNWTFAIPTGFIKTHSKPMFNTFDYSLRGILKASVSREVHNFFFLLQTALKKAWEKSNEEELASAYSASMEHVHHLCNNENKDFEY